MVGVWDILNLEYSFINLNHRDRFHDRHFQDGSRFCRSMSLSGGAAPVPAPSLGAGVKGAANGWGVGHLES